MSYQVSRASLSLTLPLPVPDPTKLHRTCDGSKRAVHVRARVDCLPGVHSDVLLQLVLEGGQEVSELNLAREMG